MKHDLLGSPRVLMLPWPEVQFRPVLSMSTCMSWGVALVMHPFSHRNCYPFTEPAKMWSLSVHGFSDSPLVERVSIRRNSHVSYGSAVCSENAFQLKTDSLLISVIRRITLPVYRMLPRRWTAPGDHRSPHLLAIQPWAHLFIPAAQNQSANPKRVCTAQDMPYNCHEPV